jgi:hypothetical protein
MFKLKYKSNMIYTAGQLNNLCKTHVLTEDGFIEEEACDMCCKESCNCDDQVENMREQEDYKKSN